MFLFFLFPEDRSSPPRDPGPLLCVGKKDFPPFFFLPRDGIVDFSFLPRELFVGSATWKRKGFVFFFLLFFRRLRRLVSFELNFCGGDGRSAPFFFSPFQGREACSCAGFRLVRGGSTTSAFFLFFFPPAGRRNKGGTFPPASLLFPGGRSGNPPFFLFFFGNDGRFLNLLFPGGPNSFLSPFS